MLTSKVQQFDKPRVDITMANSIFCTHFMTEINIWNQKSRPDQEGSSVYTADRAGEGTTSGSDAVT